MSSPAHTAGRRRRRLVALLAAVVLSALVALVAPVPVGAHSILVSATPSPGAEVELLTEVRLDFAGDVSPDGHVVTVNTAAGALAASGYEVPEPRSVLARFDTAVPAGAHEVVWEVVAADGHRDRGRIPITVTQPAPPPAATPTAPAPPSTAADGAASSAASGDPGRGSGGRGSGGEDAGTGADVAAADGSDGGDDDDGFPTMAVGIAAVAVVAGGVVAARRSRRAGSTAS